MSGRRRNQEDLIEALIARVHELETAFVAATGRDPPPSAIVDLESVVRSPGRGAVRKVPALGLPQSGVSPASSRGRVSEVSVADAAMTHPIVKEDKTARDRRMEVLSATESVFHLELQCLHDKFLLPLDQAMAQDKKTRLLDVSHITDHVAKLAQLHKLFSGELDSRIAQWISSGEIAGDVLVKYGRLLKSGMGLVNFEAEYLSIHKARSEHAHAAEIDALLAGIEKANGDVTLSQLMLRPSHRRMLYIRILDEFLVLTPANHADRANLNIAVATFKEIEAIAHNATLNVTVDDLRLSGSVSARSSGASPGRSSSGSGRKL